MKLSPSSNSHEVYAALRGAGVSHPDASFAAAVYRCWRNGDHLFQVYSGADLDAAASLLRKVGRNIRTPIRFPYEEKSKAQYTLEPPVRIVIPGLRV